MIEPRRRCPVCLGSLMEKQSNERRPGLLLDLCGRCGGVWLDAGEARLVRAGPRSRLPRATEERHRSQCHQCGAVVDRDAESCPACAYANRLHCPACDKRMERVAHEAVVLDLCRRCKGVWFDRHEIAAIWTLALTAAVQRIAAPAGPKSSLIDGVDPVSPVLDVLTYTPDLGVAIVDGAGNAVGASLELLSHVPEVAGAVAEAAGAVFEVLLQIVVAILEGLASG